MLRMKTICGRIGLLFLVPRDGPLLMVSHWRTLDTGSLLAVTEVANQNLCTRQVYVSDLVVAMFPAMVVWESGVINDGGSVIGVSF